MNPCNQQAIPYGSNNMQHLNVAQKQEVAIKHNQIPKQTLTTDALAYHSFPEGKARKIQPLQKGHTINTIVSGKTTQLDINIMVSQCFSADCDSYYKRCRRLEDLIESSLPADNDFIKALNSGPMYATHCCQFIASYRSRFKNSLVLKDTVLSNLNDILTGCPPIDIYAKIPYMEEQAMLTYVVGKGVTATQALSALTNKFSIIECNIAYQIAYYKTILLILGEEHFNQKFDRDGNSPFMVSANPSGHQETALSHFRSTNKAPGCHASIQPHCPPMTTQEGVVHYFSNHRDYIKKHPGGIARGFNVMLVNKTDSDLYFTAFGFPGKGLKPHDINQKLVDLFNVSAYDDYKIDLLYESLSDEVKDELHIFNNKTITLDELYVNQGGWATSLGDFLDINKIKINLQQFTSYNAIPPQITDTKTGLLTESSYSKRKVSQSTPPKTTIKEPKMTCKIDD